MEGTEELKTHIEGRLKYFTEEHTGVYECCKRHILDELLDIDIIINKIVVEQEEAVPV